MKKIRDDWTKGLSTRAANALLCQFKSKQELIDYINNGRMYKNTNQGLRSTVAGLGVRSLHEVRIWLGMDGEWTRKKEVKNETLLKRINAAIILLEGHGYMVSKSKRRAIAS